MAGRAKNQALLAPPNSDQSRYWKIKLQADYRNLSETSVSLSRSRPTTSEFLIPNEFSAGLPDEIPQSRTGTLGLRFLGSNTGGSVNMYGNSPAEVVIFIN